MSFIDAAGHTLEYQRFPGAGNRATMVLMHEGLGSVAMWRDFPKQLAANTAHSVVVYCRVFFAFYSPTGEGDG